MENLASLRIAFSMARWEIVRIFLYNVAAGVEATGKPHLAVFVKENEPSFHAREFEGEAKKGAEDVGDGRAGVELACRAEEPVELLHLARRPGLSFVDARELVYGRKEAGVCG